MVVDPIQIQYFISGCSSRSGYKVLDVGVGNGTSSIALGSNFKDITIIGIDNDPINVELATRNVALNKLGKGSIHFRQVDILKKIYHLISVIKKTKI
ncbi:MAG: hypothetical protein CM15mP111_3140 [Hyphomicrobiales bacterium]|nr:MAG: hypothetical protein CM15mP111_3140 [Hyphomicrobiales bacterium]